MCHYHNHTYSSFHAFWLTSQALVQAMNEPQSGTGTSNEWTTVRHWYKQWMNHSQALSRLLIASLNWWLNVPINASQLILETRLSNQSLTPVLTGSVLSVLSVVGTIQITLFDDMTISLSTLTTNFPGEPELAGFTEAMDDGCGGDNWSYKTCKAPVKSSPPTNQHPVLYRLDTLPVIQPTVSKQCTEA